MGRQLAARGAPRPLRRRLKERATSGRAGRFPDPSMTVTGAGEVRAVDGADDAGPDHQNSDGLRCVPKATGPSALSPATNWYEAVVGGFAAHSDPYSAQRGK